MLNQKAFTLVEIMVVVAIVGMLSVTLYPVFEGAIARSHDAGRISLLSGASSALDSYQTEYGRLPTSAMDGGGIGQDDISLNRTDTEIGRTTLRHISNEAWLRSTPKRTTPYERGIWGEKTYVGYYGLSGIFP